MRFLGADIGTFFFPPRDIEDRSNGVVILWKENGWKMVF